jgi:chromosome partitioning protein
MIISITNLKGGVGKTTLTTNLAVAFLLRGYKVCIVDTDLGLKSSMEWSGNRDEGLPRLPVFGVGIKQLNKEVEVLDQDYDVVFIDGSPQLSELADRTILCSDIVIIPVLPGIYDFRAFENFLERYEQVKGLKEAQGAAIKAFVILNRYLEKSNVSKEIKEALGEYEVKIMDAKLASRVAYIDTATQGMGVMEYKDAKAKAEISQIADELELAIKYFNL